jgi:hypothetical protein
MDTAYWVVAGLTALIFLTAGAMKLARPKDALFKAGMTYVEDFTDRQVKLIGLAETLGAVGLALPKAVDIAPVLGPVAGIGLAAVMVGAIATHVRRKEPFVVPVALLALAVASATLGFLALG